MEKSKRNFKKIFLKELIEKKYVTQFEDTICHTGESTIEEIKGKNKRYTMSLLIINTLPVATAQTVIDRLTARTADSRVIHTEQLNIHPCVGCNACWLKTPGRCSIKDDYEEILKAYLSFDEVIFLSGTALNFVNHRMKNLIDRLLPLATMYTHVVDGQCRHVPRYRKKISLWAFV